MIIEEPLGARVPKIYPAFLVQGQLTSSAMPRFFEASTPGRER
jgi:hypothetical protein